MSAPVKEKNVKLPVDLHVQYLSYQHQILNNSPEVQCREKDFFRLSRLEVRTVLMFSHSWHVVFIVLSGKTHLIHPYKKNFVVSPHKNNQNINKNTTKNKVKWTLLN